MLKVPNKNCRHVANKKQRQKKKVKDWSSESEDEIDLEDDEVVGVQKSPASKAASKKAAAKPSAKKAVTASTKSQAAKRPLPKNHNSNGSSDNDEDDFLAEDHNLKPQPFKLAAGTKKSAKKDEFDFDGSDDNLVAPKNKAIGHAVNKSKRNRNPQICSKASENKRACSELVASAGDKKKAKSSVASPAKMRRFFFRSNAGAPTSPPSQKQVTQEAAGTQQPPNNGSDIAIADGDGDNKANGSDKHDTSQQAVQHTSSYDWIQEGDSIQVQPHNWVGKLEEDPQFVNGQWWVSVFWQDRNKPAKIWCSQVMRVTSHTCSGCKAKAEESAVPASAKASGANQPPER